MPLECPTPTLTAGLNSVARRTVLLPRRQAVIPGIRMGSGTHEFVEHAGASFSALLRQSADAPLSAVSALDAPPNPRPRRSEAPEAR